MENNENIVLVDHVESNRLDLDAPKGNIEENTKFEEKKGEGVKVDDGQIKEEIKEIVKKEEIKEEEKKEEIKQEENKLRSSSQSNLIGAINNLNQTELSPKKQMSEEEKENQKKEDPVLTNNNIINTQENNESIMGVYNYLKIRG